MKPLELWAGPECTVNRVGTTVRDQCEETGFAGRLDDLDRIAGLGIRCIRFPLLWERTLDASGRFDWRWADARIERMEQLGLRCIAGLVHHGSGPSHTNLLDPGFAPGLGEFAGAVARRYPHLRSFTPVNEPGTTARFSGLYGAWFPHERGDHTFVRALMNQVLGVRAAMEAIRAVTPEAALVQTDDLGFTQSPPALQYQADFENERRWLSYDLLAGRVTPGHALWTYLRKHGVGAEELDSLAQRPCTPDLVGINHYLTSERYLDDRLSHYPSAMHGGNDRHRYVDVETVRVHGRIPGGFTERLRETWQRYRLPVALTEVHLGCTREEQLRWLQEGWDAAARVRSEGADVRAVVAWAVMGTVDWDSLITRRAGHYEPGLWDVRSTPPRPTALAAVAGELAAGRSGSHPVLEGAGWWRRGLRLLHPVVGEPQRVPMGGPPLLLLGTATTLAGAFARLCHMRGLPYRLLAPEALDPADRSALDAALARWQPWAVVDAVGLGAAHDGLRDPARGAWLPAALTLARACADQGVHLAAFSSDRVFGAGAGAPCVESDIPAPDSIDGDLQAEADRQVLTLHPGALVARSAAWFCAWDPGDRLSRDLARVRGGAPCEADAVQWVSPTFVRDLATATLDLLVDGERGVWHLANRGEVTWLRLLRRVAERCGLDAGEVREAVGAARSLRHRTLASERGQVMPTLADALERFVVDLDGSRAAPDQTHRPPREVEPVDPDVQMLPERA